MSNFWAEAYEVEAVAGETRLHTLIRRAALGGVRHGGVWGPEEGFGLDGGALLVGGGVTPPLLARCPWKAWPGRREIPPSALGLYAAKPELLQAQGIQLSN